MRELSQHEAASILGVSERTFRRWRDRYEAGGAEGLYDRRLGKPPGRRVPVGMVLAVLELFDDHDRAAAKGRRGSAVVEARRSRAAEAKAETGRTADGCPVHGFRGLLGDLATLTRNSLAAEREIPVTFTAYAVPPTAQKKAFELLGGKHAG